MNIDLWRVLVLLLVTGWMYNRLTAYVEAQLPDRHGVTSLLVVGGVLVTICGAALYIGVDDAFAVFLCFAASGLPMIAGSVGRYMDSRQQEQRR